MHEAFEAGAVRREEVFITTKLWNNNHRPERVGPALEASLLRLRIDYLDCYLVHTPFAFRPGDDQDPRDEHDCPLYDTISALPDDAMKAMRSGVKTGVRFNSVVEAGVAGFAPRVK